MRAVAKMQNIWSTDDKKKLKKQSTESHTNNGIALDTLINPAAVTIHRHIFTKQSLVKKGWKERKSERETENER